jgi:integrase
MTFAEVFEAWSAEHYKTIGPDGITSYNRAFDVFEPLHSRKFRDLRTEDFQKVLDPYIEKKQSASTLSKHKQLITQMSDWAIREEILTNSFASYVHVPSPKKTDKDTFSAEEIKLLEADGSEAAMVVLMLIYTGMRIGELFDIKMADYHEKYVVGGEKTEEGRARIIPIMPEGRRYFAYFAERAEGELLLSGYSGQRVARNFRNRDYYPLLERLGIARHTPRATRRTFASNARKSNMPPEILQKILGHVDYTTTANFYIEKDVEELIAAVEVC